MLFHAGLREQWGGRFNATVREVVRWHWIHGSCFLQCFMLIATAALQMRVNIAGGPSTLGRALSHGLNVKLRPAGWHWLKGHTVCFSPLSSHALSSLLMCLSASLDLFPQTGQGWNLYFSWAQQCGLSFKWKINEEIKDGCLVVAGRTLCWHRDLTGMCFWRLSCILMFTGEARHKETQI